MSKQAHKAQAPAPAHATTKVGVTLHGREYVIACDAGEEKKLAEIVKMVDAKLNEVAAKSTSPSETRLFMLTCLLLADELIETKRTVNESRRADEDLFVAAVDHLQQRILTISQQIGRA